MPVQPTNVHEDAEESEFYESSEEEMAEVHQEVKSKIKLANEYIKNCAIKCLAAREDKFVEPQQIVKV